MSNDSSNRETNIVFTVGHSNHSIEYFLNLLSDNQITALGDVRSTPYSRFNPQFNREQLAASINERSIKYVYLGHQLGGRSEDHSCYEHGRIRYDRLARKPEFEAGLRRVIKGAQDYRIVLMCSEKEPLSCHRTLLVGHKLTERGISLKHILSDGSLESHESTMTRLLAQFNSLTEDDLFVPRKERSDLIAEAIANQTDRVGHTIEQTTSQK